ncbi:hypothetical protein [Stenomitos frigidus]|uniref:Uncharacterized protein n=1 Tax=Stenomitos frigidus ULC18 TaxID=2107698 RepID=A0A2T1DUF9_9CYAN|nr:hypothetical protein [Stenomitos frigidus]PSB24120.1 hypothetical protein C7B82_28265 [Stenomitos frigidus ULC18]
MLQGLLNLTLAGVNQTIEDVLDEYPVHPYQSAFAMPELRQKLIAHIFSQVPPRHVEGVQASSSAIQGNHYTRLQARLRMEMLVRGSILHILRENAVWLSRHFSNV